MKLGLGRVVLLASAICMVLVALAVAAGGGAVWGALGRHSARFPLNLSNQAADAIWGRYALSKEIKNLSVLTGEDLTLITTFNGLVGRVFEIPLADRGGEGGATTSVGNTIVLMTHDARFFMGTANDGFRRYDGIVPPKNGYQEFYDATHLPPYDPGAQNYPNFRYNDLAFFETATGSAVLISYSYFDGERACYTNRISRFDFSDRNISAEEIVIGADDWRLLFETKPCIPLAPHGPSMYVQEAGGRMVVETETGTIYMASGNYDAENPDTTSDLHISQDPANDYGKVLAIDLETGESRHLSLGHRNPQGIAKDASGRLWIVEHGPRGGDELDLIIEGRNYGWPLAVHGTGYDHNWLPTDLSEGRHQGFEQPVLAWSPSIGPSSIIAIHDFDPAWDGDLLVGSLRGQKLVHIRLVGDRVVLAEDIPVGRRIRHLRQHTDGSIVLWNGRNELIILTRGGQSDAAALVEEIIADLDAPERVREAARAELNECMVCHSFEPGDHATAPSLALVFGSDVGSSSYANYSPALANAGGAWSRNRLIDFLRDPNGAFPGTVMPNPEIGDEEVRSAVVDVLAALRSANE